MFYCPNFPTFVSTVVEYDSDWIDANPSLLLTLWTGDLSKRVEHMSYAIIPDLVFTDGKWLCEADPGGWTTYERQYDIGDTFTVTHVYHGNYQFTVIGTYDGDVLIAHATEPAETWCLVKGSKRSLYRPTVGQAVRESVNVTIDI